MGEDRGGPRPGRTARCPRHGRIHDRRSEAGCPACASQASRLARRGPSPPAELRDGAELDPTPFRVEIQALEAVLCRPSPPDLGGCERVAVLAAELAQRVAAQPGLGRLAALRAELFVPAAWLRRSSSELVLGQQPEPPRADAIVRDGLVAWADALTALSAAGRSEMAAFGEQLVDAAEGSREERELVARWEACARGWDARVTRACAGAPPAPPRGDEPHLVQAHPPLGQAAHRLRMATVAAGDFSVPTRWWREQSLDRAGGALAEARRELALARRAERALPAAD